MHRTTRSSSDRGNFILAGGSRSHGLVHDPLWILDHDAGLASLHSKQPSLHYQEQPAHWPGLCLRYTGGLTMPVRVALSNNTLNSKSVNTGRHMEVKQWSVWRILTAPIWCTSIKPPGQQMMCESLIRWVMGLLNHASFKTCIFFPPWCK